MRHRLPLILLLACVPLPGPAQEVWSTGRTELALTMSEAKFIKLDRPATAVFLSNPEIAEVDLQSARYLYVVARGIGTTDLFVLGENDEEIISTTISVGIDADRLAKAARQAISGGQISVSTQDGAVFLNGKVPGPEDASTASDVVTALLGERAIVVNLLQVEASAQVNLQVRIAEVSRSISEDLGFSLTASSSNQRRSITPPVQAGGGFQLSLGSGSRNINLVLDALARNGLVTILSEPNLTARSGETANFLAGGRIPYPIKGDNGEVTYNFEPIGVELNFTPTVFNRDQIRLSIETSVRDVDSANSTTSDVPALTERSATTTVELGSGQSFAIAGMFKRDSIQTLSGLPGLINLPVIGTLFRSTKFSRGESELVIIVTPYLVEPTDGRNLASPTDSVAPIGSGIGQVIGGQLSRPIRVGETGSSRARRGGFLLQ